MQKIKHTNWEDHNFVLDRSRKHGRPGRVFVVCVCGAKAQASLESGKRFTTARQKKDPREIKKSAGVKASEVQKGNIKKRGFRSAQHFFDYCYGTNISLDKSK